MRRKVASARYRCVLCRDTGRDAAGRCPYGCIVAPSPASARVAAGQIADKPKGDVCPHVACPLGECFYLDEDRLARTPRAVAL